MLRIKVRRFFKNILSIIVVLAIIYIIARVFFSISNIFHEDENVDNEKNELIEKNTAIFQNVNLKDDEITSMDDYICNLIQNFNSHDYDNIINEMSLQYKEKFNINVEDIKNYCNSKFSQKKLFNYQLLSNIDNYYIYKINIYDDIISTGINNYNDYNNETIIIVINNEGNEYKFSLNEYIETIQYNTIISTERTTCTLLEKDVYYEKETIKCKIKNNTEDIMILNTSKDIFNITLCIEYDSYIDEKTISNKSNIFVNDLIIYPNEEKEYIFEFDNKYFDNNKYIKEEKLSIDNIVLVDKMDSLEIIDIQDMNVKNYIDIQVPIY